MTIEQRNAYAVDSMEKRLASMHKLLDRWAAEDAEAKARAEKDPEYKKWNYERDSYAALIHHGYKLALESMEFEFDLCMSRY